MKESNLSLKLKDFIPVAGIYTYINRNQIKDIECSYFNYTRKIIGLSIIHASEVMTIYEFGKMFS